MPERFHIRLQKEQFTFCAAHFITFAGSVCERLHGHNYRVACEVHGPLDENRYVVDFIALRDALQALVGELDHRVLLPTQHPAIRVAADQRSVEATFEDRRWVFPRGDCALLPVANTTAELLAQYLGTRLLEHLRDALHFWPDKLRLEVDECHGQWGVWEWLPE
jgi:6-pyruvoyltetrahydropterin/6-carboxytetrahydropterin synthase